jgi:hypothetical protein
MTDEAKRSEGGSDEGDFPGGRVESACALAHACGDSGVYLVFARLRFDLREK